MLCLEWVRNAAVTATDNDELAATLTDHNERLCPHSDLQHVTQLITGSIPAHSFSLLIVHSNTAATISFLASKYVHVPVGHVDFTSGPTDHTSYA